VKKLALTIMSLLAVAPKVVAADPGDELFHDKVWPLLQRACMTCHGEDEPENDLRVDTREALLQGGKTGPAVIPGRPQDSLLVKVVRWDHGEMRMPPGRKLTADEIASLETWVARGLPWPAPKVAPMAAAAANTGPRWRRPLWTGPPRPVPAPALDRLANRANNDLDRFVLARLQEFDLQPVAPAGRRAWLRRATYVLTGALPTAAELQAFLADADERRACTAAIERLLASPRYGEHWAELWPRVALPDTATAGAPARARYAGWVAAAFNADQPLDAFVRSHLGGGGAAASFVELVAPATRLDGHAEPAAHVAAVGTTFLGLDVDCARCHDHPQDPLRTSDYRALAALVRPHVSPGESAPDRAPSPFVTTLAIAENPLVARVVVNQVWRVYFGRGIVASQSFGSAGEPPSHPLLLDHLAAKLVAAGGSLKALHREILLSATFGLAVARAGGQGERDPDNVLLWRARPLVVEDEAAERGALALLDPPGGGVRQSRSEPLGEALWRHAGAAARAAAEKYALEQAKKKAAQAGDKNPAAGPPDKIAPPRVGPRETVWELYRTVLGRDPTADEVAYAVGFVASHPARGSALARALVDSLEWRTLL
jgi:hypothetical protein